MALRKPNSEAQVSASFEDVVVDDAPQKAETAPAASAAQAGNPAPAQAKPASAVAVQSDAAKRAAQFREEFEAMRGASDFSYGTYTVFKGDNGRLARTAGKEGNMGAWAEVRLLGWDTHHEISPGSREKASKDFVAYSKDGVAVDTVIGEELKHWIGKPVKEYLEYLKVTEEYTKASCKCYADLAVAVLRSDVGDFNPADNICVTLAPSSMTSFKGYQEGLKNRARMVELGVPGVKFPEDPFRFFLVCEVASSGGDTWTKLAVCADLPSRLAR